MTKNIFENIKVGDEVVLVGQAYRRRSYAKVRVTKVNKSTFCVNGGSTKYKKENGYSVGSDYSVILTVNESTERDIADWQAHLAEQKAKREAEEAFANSPEGIAKKLRETDWVGAESETIVREDENRRSVRIFLDNREIVEVETRKDWRYVNGRCQVRWTTPEISFSGQRGSVVRMQRFAQLLERINQYAESMASANERINAKLAADEEAEYQKQLAEESAKEVELND